MDVDVAIADGGLLAVTDEDGPMCDDCGIRPASFRGDVCEVCHESAGKWWAGY